MASEAETTAAIDWSGSAWLVVGGIVLAMLIGASPPKMRYKQIKTSYTSRVAACDTTKKKSDQIIYSLPSG